MQKLTIHTPLPDSPVRRVAKYNIGQKVYVIEWRDGTPFILEGYILFIGISHPIQNHDFLYKINRDFTGEEFKQYYEKDVYPTRIRVIRALATMMRKNLKMLKEMASHPYNLRDCYL